MVHKLHFYKATENQNRKSSTANKTGVSRARGEVAHHAHVLGEAWGGGLRPEVTASSSTPHPPGVSHWCFPIIASRVTCADQLSSLKP